jgi:hypothetical protein
MFSHWLHSFSGTPCQLGVVHGKPQDATVRRLETRAPGWFGQVFAAVKGGRYRPMIALRDMQLQSGNLAPNRTRFYHPTKNVLHRLLSHR